MALDTGVIAAHVIELFRIDDVVFGGVFDMQTAGSVALFTAYIPLCHLFGLDVVVDGMAPITGGPGGAVEVGWAVKRHPPICSCFHVVGEPAFFLNVPLRGKRVIVIAPPGEIALLPVASIDERHLIETECDEWIGVREVSEYGFGMDLWIAHDIGHAGLLPAVVGLSVAFTAAFRSDKVGHRALGADGS